MLKILNHFQLSSLPISHFSELFLQIFFTIFSNSAGPPPTGGENKVHLNISIALLEVREVDEVGGMSTIKFSFKRDWSDPRLLFDKLNNGIGELTPNETGKIWLPWTICANLKDKSTWFDTDKLKEYRLKLKGTAHPSEPNHNGTDVAISYEREAVVQFMCDFDMFWYPFDKQSCGVEFYQRETDIILVPKSIEYQGPTDLEQYTVEGVFLCDAVLQVGL